MKDEILELLYNKQEETILSSIRRDIPHIENTTALSKIFDVFAQNNSQISIVVDNYGSLVGVLTMEDLLETILGFEITDETDTIADLQEYARKKWEQRVQTKGLI